MGVAADYVSRTRIGAHFHSARESRKLILVIVAVALLLDNMLLTTVGEFLNFFLFYHSSLLSHIGRDSFKLFGHTK